MAKTKIKRRGEIIRQLSEMSRGGWSRVIPADYLPLERELKEIDNHK